MKYKRAREWPDTALRAGRDGRGIGMEGRGQGENAIGDKGKRIGLPDRIVSVCSFWPVDKNCRDDVDAL